MSLAGAAGWFADGRGLTNVTVSKRCFRNTHLFNIGHRGLLIFADVIADIIMIHEMMHANQSELATLSSIILTLHSVITGILAYNPKSKDPLPQKILRGVLQFFYLQVFIEIYTSIQKSKSTKRLRLLKMWECVFNAVLQLWIQIYFLIVQYSGDTTPFAYISILTHIISITSTIHYTDVYGFGTSIVIKCLFIICRVCDVTSRACVLAIGAAISDTLAWAVLIYFFLSMVTILLVKIFTKEEGSRMRDIEYGMLALFSYDFHYLNLTSFFFNFLKLADTTIFVMIIGSQEDSLDGKVKSFVWWVLSICFAVVYAIFPALVKFGFHLDLYMMGRKHRSRELKDEKIVNESKQDQALRYGVLKLLVKRGAIEPLPDFRRPFVLNQKYDLKLLCKHELLESGGEEDWMDHLWKVNDWPVLGKLLRRNPEFVLKINSETKLPEREIGPVEQFHFTKHLLEHEKDKYTFKDLEDLHFFKSDKSMHEYLAGWLLKECAEQVSWDLMYEKSYVRTEIIVAWRIAQERATLSEVCSSMDCKRKIGHEVTKFLLYELKMKWWLKNLWESVSDPNDLYEELLKAIPFKGGKEEGARILRRYRDGDYPEKPPKGYLDDSDDEESEEVSSGSVEAKTLKTDTMKVVISDPSLTEMQSITIQAESPDNF